jgi:hypothetical protein
MPLHRFPSHPFILLMGRGLRAERADAPSEQPPIVPPVVACVEAKQARFAQNTLAAHAAMAYPENV